jgi:hypothetical protein
MQQAPIIIRTMGEQTTQWPLIPTVTVVTQGHEEQTLTTDSPTP